MFALSEESSYEWLAYDCYKYRRKYSNVWKITHITFIARPLQAFCLLCAPSKSYYPAAVSFNPRNVKDRIPFRLLKGRVVKGQRARGCVVEGASGALRSCSTAERELGLRKDPRGHRGPLISMTCSPTPRRSQSGATLINTWSLQEGGGKCLNMLKMCSYRSV